MTATEAMTWRAYMVRRGTLNVGLRLEAGFAMLADLVHHAAFKAPHPSMEQYMPHVVAGSEDQPAPAVAPSPNRTLDLSKATIEEAFEVLTRMAYATKAAKPKPRRKAVTPEN